MVELNKGADEALRKKLKDLNNEVENAIKKRTLFLDENMKFYAPFPIGEKVINLKTLENTIVSEHYRIHRNKPEYDTCFSVECRFKNGDNTSHYAGLHPYIHPYIRYIDCLERNENYVNTLERIARSK